MPAAPCRSISIGSIPLVLLVDHSLDEAEHFGPGGEPLPAELTRSESGRAGNSKSLGAPAEPLTKHSERHDFSGLDAPQGNWGRFARPATWTLGG
jgi:hypothetical protein